MRRRVLASARARILLAFVLVLGFASLTTIFLVRQVLLARATERVDQDLAQEVDEFRRLVEDGRDPRTGDPFGTDLRAMFDVFLSRNVPSEGETIYTFVNGREHRRVTTVPVPPVVEAEVMRLGRLEGSPRRGEVVASDVEVRYLAVPVRVGDRRDGVFAVTGDLRREQRQAADAIRVTALVSLAALALASLLGLIVTGRVLRPLRLMTSTARQITESDLTRRITVTSEDEIGELGRTFNQMLDRLQSAFTSQRELVSDAGHELRTPITIIRGHLDLLGEDPAERAETMAIVHDELDRMTRLVDDLLTLAKAERADFLRPEPLDLDELTPELFAKARQLGERDWRLGAVGAGRFTGDRQRLTQAVMNLAENAARHTPPGGTVELSSTQRDGTVSLAVRDTGPGVAPADRERIFERFTRGRGRVPVEGSGLGLAIVKAIAEAHGGRVALDTELGAGATFTIVIPTGEPA